MARIFLTILSVFLLYLVANGQVNQTDTNGLRQGLWKKYYPNGKLIYEGTFIDNKPVEKWKRYHDNGIIRAEINYSATSDSACARLFDKSGNLIAEGVYIDEKKEGKWRYLSDGRLASEEEFQAGVKNGISRKYYQTGELLEELEWSLGQLNGKYRAFYKNGKPYLECMYKENQRDGFCIASFENGKMEMDAFYKEGSRHGEWKFFNPDGGLSYILKYDNGRLLNPSVLDSIHTKRLNELDSNIGKIPDPEEFLDDPSEYLIRGRMNR